MLQKLQWDSLQQRRTRSRVQLLYRIWNDLVAIRASAHLQPAAILIRGSETRYRQIHIQSYLFSKCSLPVEHTSCWCLPAAAGQLQGSTVTVHHRTNVDACRPCFYPLHHTVHCLYPLCLLCCLAPLLPRRAPGPITVARYCSTSKLAPSWKKNKIEKIAKAA